MAHSLFLLGAGSMAEAFIRGLVSREAVPASDILVMNRSNRDRLSQLQAEYGVRPGRPEDAAQARVVVLAAKPADAQAAITQVLPYLDGQVLLSFAAGVPIRWLEDATDGRAKVVRTMPNLPMAVLAGATAMSASPVVTADDLAYVRFLLEQTGIVVELEEHLMDAATAFSGSGPGFVSYFLEAMEDAAVRLGIDASTARKLLLQTVVGTARVLEEWGLSPHELRRRVTSPNGTTHAGMQVFTAHQLAATVDDALQAAARRATEMGQMYSEP
ncbi:MAG: pyrroline-5-carboxylate reductase [Alicyclobacillus sp.]|nr:pyrroline-5-carboxylate reductase [Alicyclobacillus sp.]